MMFAWLSIVLVFTGYEFWSLRRGDDAHEPFTYYVRKVLGNWGSPLRWIGLGFYLWIGVHFFVDS